MANLTLRLVKGSPLTYAEVDDNFTALNNATGQFKNVLINGNFDIWQRGTSFTGTSQYGADRWIHTHGDGASTTSRQAFTLGQTDVPNEPEFFWRHDRTSASTVVNGVITQRIESVRTFAGQTITLSIWAKVAAGTKSLVPRVIQSFGTGGSPSSSIVTSASAITVTTSWQKFTVTFSIPSISGKTIGTNNDDFLQVDLNESSSFGTFTLDVAQAQVEKGSLATEFERRPIGTEFALCERYTKVLGLDGATNIGLGNGFADSSTQTIIGIPLPTKMRTNPSAIVSSPSDFQIRISGASTIVVDTFSILTTHPDYVRVAPVVTSGLTQGQGVQLVAANSSARITLSAEL